MNITGTASIMPSSALRAGQQGVRTGLDHLAHSGAEIARLNGESTNGQAHKPNLEASLVEQTEAKHLVQSNARTIAVAADTLGTLLDVKA